MAGGKNLVGLDVGSTHLKVAQIREGRTRHKLLNFGIKPLPPETIVDRHIMNAQSVTDAVRELFSEKKIRLRDSKRSLEPCTMTDLRVIFLSRTAAVKACLRMLLNRDLKH